RGTGRRAGTARRAGPLHGRGAGRRLHYQLRFPAAGPARRRRAARRSALRGGPPSARLYGARVGFLSGANGTSAASAVSHAEAWARHGTVLKDTNVLQHSVSPSPPFRVGIARANAQVAGANAQIAGANAQIAGANVQLAGGI